MPANHSITNVLSPNFSKRTFNVRSSKHIVYKTPVLCMLLKVRKMCVNERAKNMHYSIYTFNMRLTYV